MIQRLYIIFDNGSYHYGNGVETFVLAAAKPYFNLVEAEHAASSLIGVHSIKLEEDARHTAEALRRSRPCASS